MSALSGFPAMADLCRGRNDTLRAACEAGGLSLDEYIRRESRKAVENARQAPLTDPASLFARAGEYAASLLGPDAGRDVEAAMHCMAACTADHHGGLYSAQMFQGDILFGLMLEKLGHRGRYVPILSVGQVELDNSTYARGICAYLTREGKQTFPIYKEDLHSQMASCAGPMNPTMYARLRRKHIEQVDASDAAALHAAELLSEILPACYETEEVLKAAGLREQATLVGASLSRNLFRGEAPIYAFLEMEELIRPLLLSELRGEGALIPALLYDEALRRELQAESMPDGGTLAGGLFRGVDAKGRKINLVLGEDGFLTGRDKRGNEIRWKAEPETLSQLLCEGKLLPAGFLMAVFLFFERGLTWYGGIFQAVYLPVWRDFLARALKRGGYVSEAEHLEAYECSGHISGPVYALYRGDGFAAPAGPVEFWEAKPEFERIRELVRETGIWNSHLMAMPEIYFDLTRREERVPDWYRLITQELYQRFPENSIDRRTE